MTTPSKTTSGFSFGAANASENSGSTFSFNPSTPSSAVKETSTEGEEHHDLVAEEESTAHFEPIVKLAAVDVKTGQEDEEELLCVRARLYRWAKELNADSMEWKQRGTGDIKLLKHKTRGTVRVLLRQEKTLKVCANHVITSAMELKEHQGSTTTWTYFCPSDFSGGEVNAETFAIRFRTEEAAEEFEEAFNKAKANNIASVEADVSGNDTNGSDADDEASLTEDLKNLSVQSSDKHKEKTEPEKNENKDEKDEKEEEKNEKEEEKDEKEVTEKVKKA
eukprot:CFRG5563T1